MKFEEALEDIFEERAQELTPRHRRMLRALWEHGRRESWRAQGAAFDQGRSAGLQELGVLFTKVLAKRPVYQVFMIRSREMRYQPWVQAALQQVMDAPNLEEAQRVASELGKLDTSELMKRVGTSKEIVKHLHQGRVFLGKVGGDSMSEVDMLEGLWERGDDESIRQANEEFEKRERRRRR